jgi:hypothetical protein
MLQKPPDLVAPASLLALQNLRVKKLAKSWKDPVLLSPSGRAMCSRNDDAVSGFVAAVAFARRVYMEERQGPGVAPLAHPPHKRGRFLVGGIALALALSLGVIVFLGASSAANPARAAPGASSSMVPRMTRTPRATMTGQCGGNMTVTRVTNRTITVTRPDGTTETVYVNSHTHYTRYGQNVNLSAIKVGSRIYVVGTCTNGGRRINATSIEIVG